MLYIMGQSALWGWAQGLETQIIGHIEGERPVQLAVLTPTKIPLEFARDIVRRFAVPQFILALLALTTYHVQIITRISSGYPVWYWWLALMMADHYELQLFGQKWNTSRLAVRWMVLYAMIQGGLFSSFLPPA